jgi:hypothetical protein
MKVDAPAGSTERAYQIIAVDLYSLKMEIRANYPTLCEEEIKEMIRLKAGSL